ncbi:hypothetical protein [Flavobacterium sp. C3NV]|uniref:hypothetical protein n=1 Tax=Flavobacterium sp. C3NV TaxID=3393358 RepID=UPI0039903405
MKKILTLFAVVGLIVFSSCEGDQGPPGLDAPLPYVFDAKNINFSRTSNSGTYIDFPSKIYSGDVVLVYRYDGLDPDNGLKIWKPLPSFNYYNNGNVYFSFNFDFTQRDVRVYVEGFDLDINPIPTDLSNNQTFRIVIVPGDDGINTNKSVNKSNYLDYYQVIKKYNIDDSNVK